MTYDIRSSVKPPPSKPIFKNVYSGDFFIEPRGHDLWLKLDRCVKSSSGNAYNAYCLSLQEYGIFEDDHIIEFVHVDIVWHVE